MILALAVRITAFTVAKHQKRFYHGDQAYHTEIGRNVMQGNGLKFDNESFLAYRRLIRDHPNGWVDLNELERRPDEISDRNPSGISHIDFGYGVLAGLIWKCRGKIDWTPIILLQIVIDSSMCFLIYLIGRNIGDRRKGLLVALFFALFPLEIRLAILPTYSVWVSFFYISSVYLLLVERRQEKRWSSLAIVAAIGILSAYTAWIRSTVVLFPMFMAAYFLLKRKRFQWVKAAILITVFSCAYLTPKAWHTYTDSGVFRITRGTAWFSFYCGLGQFKNDFGIDHTDGSAIEYCIEQDPSLVEKSYTASWQRYEELLETRVKEIIRENPLWYAGTVLKRAVFANIKVDHFRDNDNQKVYHLGS